MDPFSPTAPGSPLRVEGFEHERLLFLQDRASGLKAVVAIHSTALGPALGGTRFRAYAGDDEAVADVLELSRGMSYKNAVAGLDFGGGKGLIIGDPARLKTKELLLAYGRFVESLGGLFVTGPDAGTDSSDTEVLAGVCRWVVSGPRAGGGAAETARATALGLFHGMRAAAYHRWGTSSLHGRVVGVAGVGKVGRPLVEHLVDAGASVVVTDVREEPVARLVERFPGVAVVDDPEALIRFDGVDVYSPCAFGGVLNDDTASAITAGLVCGAANNQLAHPGVERQLADRGVLYVPDYVVNAGGVIQAAGDLLGHSPQDTAEKVERVFDTTIEVLERADEEGLLAGVVADRIAEQRIATAARERTLRSR